MAQKTNLNVTPYFDDFDPNKNYYRILFNPGRPVQTRELNTLQTILQNQIESFGSNIFKEGSLVVPGSTTYDSNYFAVKLNPLNFGVDISLYLEQLIGKKIIGQSSGISATVQYASFTNTIDIEYPTLFVKYITSDSNNQFNPFTDGESLYCDENITYGNTVINSGTIFSTLISTDATSIGSAVSIADGIYFIRGTFVKVNKETLILNPYENSPSFRVGLKVSEEIINAKDDSSLYDNAKGFTNYAAPGADRLKISVKLSKKNLDDFNDTDFVEILRIKNGKLQKVENKTQYNILKDYLAQRTYDESGNYTVSPFKISAHNSLNDVLGNDGLFFETEKTDQGNVPSDDLMCVKFSPGKAYVKGYDIEKISTTILDVDKPRDTQSRSGISVPFEMGNIIRVNNVSGAPLQKSVVELRDGRKGLNNSVGIGTTIGKARVYNFSVTDAAYTSSATDWDLHLFDIQTYTRLVLNLPLTSLELSTSTYIEGKNSGASGYSAYNGDGTTTIYLLQTSGSFSVGEQISFNGITTPTRSIVAVDVYSSKDIKSIFQTTSVSGLTTFFNADAKLYPQSIQGFSGNDFVTITPTVTGSAGTITSPGKLFSGIKAGNIVRYSRPGLSTSTYNVVTSVSTDGLSVTVAGLSTVYGVCDGGISTSVVTSKFNVLSSSIRNEQDGYLFSILENKNISSVNLTGSSLPFTAHGNVNITLNSSATTTLTVGDFNLPTNQSGARFRPFDEERYSIFYTNGTIENLTSDKVNITNNQLVFTGISSTKTIDSIYASFVKPGIQSKVKTRNRSQRLNVGYSKYVGSGVTSGQTLNDGLTYNKFYGLRVQDKEISLNYPDAVKVLAVYESLNTSNPVLDQLGFLSLVNVQTNALIGENIVGSDSKAIARIVSKPISSPDNLEFVYLNSNRFSEGEEVIFQESNIRTNIQTIINGSYKNLTYDYTLDKAQRNQYYDYSRIVRNPGVPEPTKKLSIIFDYYSVPSGDTGDLFTVLSYSGQDYSTDIPSVGTPETRASDILDFRPYVPVFTSTSSSPFSFDSRNFSSSLSIIPTPGEESILGYSFYLPRIDKIYLNKLGEFYVEKGISSLNPKPPVLSDDVMELATMLLPAYLYSSRDVAFTLVDNKRYTMRDIGKIEDRVENLEKVTSLSLLELNTATLQIQDANNLNRFRTGFFVDDFRDDQRINKVLSSVEVDRDSNRLTPLFSRNSLANQLIPETQVTDENLDLSSNYNLLDANVQKTGNAVTLKYEPISWIEQPLATKVENVNPFHVVVYTGKISLSPQRDSWVRTVQLADRTVFVTNTRSDIRETQQEFNQRVANPNLAGQTITSTTQRLDVSRSQEISSVTVNGLESTQPEAFMRSRNVEFSAVNLRPNERYYQFLDGNSGVYFIPKLVEIATDSTLNNYGASGAFTVGETVVGSYGGKNIITFRVAKSNHKSGSFSSPSQVYTQNPYALSEIIPSEYSQSSKVLNIDTFSLSQESQGKYSGYLVRGAILVGQTSGVVAYVKDLRLIADNYGSVTGSFFLEDPNKNPAPTVRIATGTKTFKLSSSSTNEAPLPGSTSISSGETNYISEGTVEYYRRITTQTTTNVTTLTVNNITTRTTFYDPLAQSFVVGGNIEAPNGLNQNEDVNGAFLTAVDIFFARKDTRNSPVTCEIRTVELGTPTRTVLGQPVTLNPDQIQISSDASVATKFTFPYPIFLPPGNQYAVVLLAPESDQYEVWIAEMGENTVNSSTVPGVENVRYTRQFAIGRLYKSQNGAEWTANDYQDMKFKLYKANFTSSTGTAFFHNTTLDQSNGYVDTLSNNSLVTYPRRIKARIAGINNANIFDILNTGRKIGQSKNTFTYGYIYKIGGPVSQLGISTSGTNYTNSTSVSTYNIIGDGTGLVLDIVTTASGQLLSASIINGGNGYANGDVVGIVTSSTTSNTGTGAQITVNIATTIDSLYLDNFVGDNFTSDGTSTLVYYDDTNTRVSWAGTTYTGGSALGGLYVGDTIEVKQLDHGMYATNNKITISNAISNIPPVQLTSPLTVSSTAITVAAASTTNFGTFEGMPVSSANPGYLKIDNEIIKYESVSSNGTIGGLSRGRDSTIAITHENGSLVYKYELNGVSLRRINTTFTLDTQGGLDTDIDRYYIRIDRTSTNSNIDRAIDRDSSDGILPNSPLLNFSSLGGYGGDSINATKNILYTSISPSFETIIPGTSTGITAKIRTVSGTSIDGNEASFIDQGYEDVIINRRNLLSSSRIICSKINETTYLNAMPRNKSLITALTLSSSNPALSPLVFVDNSFTEFSCARFNNPIANYADDGRVNSITDDPNVAYYVSNTVRLEQPSSNLRIILSAYRHSSADIRVLYSLIRPDSSEIEQSFELFPGYDNLTIDNNQDGFLDIVNPSKNSGLPDIRVPSSLNSEFREYQYTAYDIGPFTGFTIKIIFAGTNQAYPPIIKDLRAIALA